MKKLIIIFILLCLLYGICQFGLSFFSQGHEMTYMLDQIQVKENYFNRGNKHYELKIQFEKIPFSIWTNETFSSKKQIIKEVSYFKDTEYKCIYPIFENKKQIVDVLCENNNIIYPYQSIQGKNKKLDAFVQSLGSYQLPVDDKKVIQKKDGGSLYAAMPTHSILAVENYKGISLLSSEVIKKKLFSHDSYERSIHTFIGDYYITADYNQEYEFHEFYVIDIKSGKESKIISNSSISMDSYVQGIIGDSIYLIDRNQKKQFEINRKDKTIIEVGNVKKGMKTYHEGEWKTENFSKALQVEFMFSEHITTIPNEIYFMRRKEKNGYYWYKKVENRYAVYRTPEEKTEYLTYLFTTDSVQKIQINQENIYFQDGNDIKKYKDGEGIQTVYTNPELGFNPSLIFGIVRKR